MVTWHMTKPNSNLQYILSLLQNFSLQILDNDLERLVSASL
jgi:hypothetical protein